ncbi:Oxidoreductase [Alteromonas sp. 38]|uniref:Gfo/Idh/MocA family protein n=1 Tax=Alteromonas TaxID=226 RepID=UPI0012F170FC|nr:MULTISPECIES: Gfo/Idh/MocA family oxidoreductase [Alteromonas]CAD5272907.1 Oxidoreductase [Alteromonas sp. 154]VXB54291.1 Oxidoreductase [Alteromonas sp. 38]
MAAKKEKVIKWGVVTAGRITHTFARDIKHCVNTEIAAVASRDDEKARRFQLEHSVETTYDNYQALFNDENVDAVYIGSPHTFHFEHAVAAMRAGKHILCEKPITTSESKLLELMSVATEEKVFLMEAMWTWFLPAIKKARDWYRSGKIGELIHLKCDFGYHVPYCESGREYDPKLAGGCLFDMGIYPIAFNRLFNASAPKEMQGNIHRAPNGVDDDVIWQLKYENSISSLHTSFRARLPNSGHLIGTEGTICIPDFFRSIECSLMRDDKIEERFQDNRKGSGFEFQIDHACKRIRQGETQSDVVTWKDSLNFLKDIETIRQKAISS